MKSRIACDTRADAKAVAAAINHIAPFGTTDVTIVKSSTGYDVKYADFYKPTYYVYDRDRGVIE